MNAELWVEGLGIMSIGVGVVFAFIILTKKGKLSFPNYSSSSSVTFWLRY